MIPSGRYTRIAMLLHWLVAVLIIANVALIWTVDLWPDDAVRPVIDTHKSIGITVLGLSRGHTTVGAGGGPCGPRRLIRDHFRAPVVWMAA
jgi:hypothetical protein